MSKSKIKLLILDVDGVMTDGHKIYDQNHMVVFKKFQDKDFTAIKRFKASGIKVIFLSGDKWNKQMAKKRNIDIYISRGRHNDKSEFISIFKKNYSVSTSEIAYVGDDLFDLSIIKELKYTFCTSDSPKIIKDNCFHILKSKGGENVIVELYEYFLEKNYIKDSSLKKLYELDSQEISSKNMS